MLGGLLYYQPFPRKRFEFHMLPMYAFGNQSFAGSAGATYRFFTYKIFRKIELRSRAAYFANFLRLKHSIAFHFLPPTPRTELINVLTLQAHQFAERFNSEWQMFKNFRPYVMTLDWRLYYKKALWEGGVNYNFNYHTDQAIMHSLTLLSRWQYKQKSWVQIRFFAGGFLTNNDVPNNFELRLSGSQDFRGEHLYMDRALKNPVLGQQIFEDQGGFRTFARNLSNPFLRGEPGTHRWLWATNLDFQFPFRYTRSLFLFADLGMMPDWQNADGKVYYMTGVSLRLLRQTLRINLPVWGNFYANNFPANWSDFSQRITFTLDINGLWRSFDF